MKKLIALGGCIWLFQSFSHAALSDDAIEQANGRKVLVKALAVVVNTNAHRKVAPKNVALAGSGHPPF
ncbi:hypothetical protein [Flavisolibacter ginsenosidimutans]|uniref:Uncharacterized protein n=1 Tax=Flavisolibacter ginsenosidimutans TaxID=661481 RepID=A0A5B8UEE1_9BACT|nr:hypothetical protein [Flavisolibacter ginsenosidimutans]QEC54792.1 hypothetical protein FSB75_02375 [Flavisolibacter ginsenosidimutans]